MNVYEFKWLDGKIEKAEGNTWDEAFMALGYRLAAKIGLASCRKIATIDYNLN